MPDDASDTPSIEKLVPHRLPMRVIDSVISFDATERTIVCSAALRSSPLARGNVVRAVVALEHMAQAAAACTSLLESEQGMARRGFLVAVPSLTLEMSELRVEDRLEVRATRVTASGNSASFECEVTRASQRVARCRLLVVREALS